MMLRPSNGLLLLGALGSVALLGSLVATGEASFLSVLVLAGVAILTVAFDRTALLLLLGLLPTFGNRPGSDQAALLLMVSAAWQLASLPALLRMQRTQAREVSGLWAAATVYVGVSVLSLCGTPLIDWWHELQRHTPALRDFSALSYFFAGFFRITEDQLRYGLLSVYWTLCAWQFGLYVLLLVRSERVSPARVWTAIQGSLLFALLVGVLDYYEAIDLRAVRALDPVVNPSDTQFRLQSWFGHSGWFAEFVTLAAPSTLVWLLAPWRFSLRLFGLLLVLVLGEFVLILTFQRGGWLAYPATLLFVWAAVYASHRLSHGEPSFVGALRKSIGKIVITVPLTLLLSGGIIWTLAESGVGASAKQVSIGRYLERAKDITRSSDRTQFFKAGVMLGSLSPLLGGGSELFAYHFEREFQDPHGAFYGAMNLPLHGSAHNVYAQTFAGKGLCGLVSLLALLALLSIRPALVALRSTEVSQTARICLFAGAASGLAFLIYGNVQEVFYIQPLQVLFFAIVGVTAGIVPNPNRSLVAATRPTAMVVALGCILLLHLLWQYGWPGTVRQRTAYWDQFGCYPFEQVSEEASSPRFRWCGPRAQMLLADRSVLEIEPAPYAAAAGTHAFTIRASGDGTGEHWEESMTVLPGKKYEIQIPVSTHSKVKSQILTGIADGPLATGEDVGEHAHQQDLGLYRMQLGTCLIPARDMRAKTPAPAAYEIEPSDVERTFRMGESALLAALVPPQRDRRCLAFKIWER